ncbi:KxYKxGKxW signal peptide domain-containing protein [Limosilactobacillus coleohominis]
MTKEHKKLYKAGKIG